MLVGQQQAAAQIPQHWGQVQNQGENNVSGQSNQNHAGGANQAFPGNYANQQQLSLSGALALLGAANIVEFEKPEPLKADGIKIGEITGWRGWRYQNGFLWSMSAGTVWAPNEPMDGKIKGNQEHNGCYAYKLLRTFLATHQDLDVWGEVEMWGRIIEHELGYRSEWAKIVSLDSTRLSKTELYDLRVRYGVAA